MIDYVSLHNHTSFSIMDALTKPQALFERCKELGQKAVAITDHGTMAGLWDALKASRATGVKLIAGSEFNFVNDVNDKDESLRHIILLAKNAEGYKNLLALNKLGYDNFIVSFKKAVPRIDWKLLKEHSGGLICTTACGNGILSQPIMRKDFDSAKAQAKKLKDIFGDSLAIELQGHTLVRKATAYSGEIDQRFINLQLKKIAEELNIRCIVATDSHYLDKKDQRAHDVLLAIGAGHPVSSGARLTYPIPEFYVKSAIEVAHHFVRLNTIYSEEFVRSLFENTIYFADQCEFPEWIDPKFTNPSGKELPEFPVQNQSDYSKFVDWKDTNAPNLSDPVAYLRYRCECNFQTKVPVGKEAEYRARLDEELDVIEYHGFSSYMLIVADYIEFARKNNVRIGAGRGSVGASIIAYLINIHCSDPIKYKMIFSRFHNKSKTSFPDIDIDIASSGRELIIKYISDKYGEACVAHVSNVNTMKPKVYVKDIARTFEYGGGRSEAAKISADISDIIPSDPTAPKTMTKALEKIPLLAAYAEQYTELAEFADIIGGSFRAWSTHAAGVIIGSRKLADIVPLRRDVHNNIAIEYEKERAEENGLVKVDLLGLTNLDIIDEIYRLIIECGKTPPVEPFDYEISDQKSYELISNGNCMGIFQMAGAAIPLCKAIKPKSIEDLAMITALIRPSAKAIVNDLIAVREGKKEMQLAHPRLERAFAGTYGYGLFEESLMYLAKDVAGWDLHKADRLRKLTKDKGKHADKVVAWREEFIVDAITTGLDKETATKIWDNEVANFEGYGFNIPHATLYSMITFHTAYLKAHFPLEFLTANLKSEVNANTKQAKDNIQKIKDEIRALKVKIVAPDVNTSDTTYKIVDQKTLMTGLNSLKYMGTTDIPEILAKRPYASFEDFIGKIDNVRSQAIQALAASGCLDSFNISRKMMFLHAKDYKTKYKAWQKKKPEKRGPFKYPWPENEKEWAPAELFALEKYYIGEGISGTVQERFEGFFDGGCTDFRVLPQRFKYRYYSDDEKENRRKNSLSVPNENYRISALKGIISSVFAFKVKKEDSKLRGQTMARLTVQDPWGNELAVLIFPDTWKAVQEYIATLSANKQKIEPGIAVRFIGTFQYENEHTQSFILDDILDYRSAPALPADLKAKKVKMPRGKAAAKENADIEALDKEELADDLEDEMIDDGVSSVDDDDYEYDFE